MKLKNKNTGELGNFVSTNWNEVCLKILDDNGVQLAKYGSLAELNKEWEDVSEGPKELKTHWYIYGSAPLEVDEQNWDKDFIEELKSVGNYFDTPEEAEKAVEKLKAWKRLRDKGVEFYGWRKNHTGTYDFLARWRGVPPKMHEVINDLDLLFGGEE